MKEEKKERSVIGAVATTFTVKWIIQTIAAWALSQYFTKLWKKYMKKEDKKED